MEMMLINSDWESRKTVKKGTLGEKIVQRYLESKGLNCYQSVTDGAHIFDFLVAKGKDEIKIVEVKSKARMNRRPETGINYRHFREYCAISRKHKMKVYLFFVDEKEKRIYGNDLKVLVAPRTCYGVQYPYKDTFRNGADEMILFPLDAMKTITYLNDEDVFMLKELSSRNYEYADIKGRDTS